MARLRRQLPVKDDLKEQVTQLIPQLGPVLGLDCIEYLVGLLDQHRSQRAKGLLTIPRTPLRRSQFFHQPD